MALKYIFASKKFSLGVMMWCRIPSTFTVSPLCTTQLSAQSKALVVSSLLTSKTTSTKLPAPASTFSSSAGCQARGPSRASKLSMMPLKTAVAATRLKIKRGEANNKPPIPLFFHERGFASWEHGGKKKKEFRFQSRNIELLVLQQPVCTRNHNFCISTAIKWGKNAERNNCLYTWWVSIYTRRNCVYVYWNVQETSPTDTQEISVIESVRIIHTPACWNAICGAH